MPETITSPDNALFKLFESLRSARGIKKAGLVLVSGRKIVPDRLAAGGEGKTLLLAEGMAAPADLTAGLRVNVLGKALFAELDEFGTGAPLLVEPMPAMEPPGMEALPEGLVIGVAAQDPVNLGAILRSSLAFGAAAVILFQEAAHPFLPRVTRAAAGANFRIRMISAGPVAGAGGEWVGLDMTGLPLGGFRFPHSVRLLLGEEGQGLPKEFSGPRISIPILRQAESLNVAVAAGIAMAAYRREHPL